jgi:hypothetical protein
LTASNEEMPGSEEGVQPGHHHRLDVYGRERENTRAERREQESFIICRFVSSLAGQYCTPGKIRRCAEMGNVPPLRRVTQWIILSKFGPIKMTLTERYPSSSNSYGSSGRAPVADAPQNDLAS